jgi:hypothetical protein
MSAPRFNPKPPSKAQFWARRIVALIVVGLVVWLVVVVISAVLGFFGGLFGGKSSSPSSSQASTSAASGKPTTCLPAGIQVQTVIGDGSQPLSAFAAGVNPKHWFTITNTSSKDCYFNVGAIAQHVVITSGAETIWDSANCKDQGKNMRILLKAGVALNSSPATWPRVHSSATGCDATQAPATGGGASYHIQYTVNGVKGNDVQFILN